MQIKLQNEFPYLEKFKEKFDVTDKTLFAYDHIIYSNYPVSDDLLIHETTHHKQQDKYGLEEWLKYYLEDDKFRLKMEIEAYRKQLESIQDRNQRAKLRMEVSKHLSSPLYGNIISYEEALRVLK